MKRIDTRPYRHEPKTAQRIRAVITTEAQPSRAGAPYHGTKREWVGHGFNWWHHLGTVEAP